MSYMGCSDGACIFGHPGGMHTNGGCHCLDVRAGAERARLREKILALRQERDAAEAAVGRYEDRVAGLEKENDRLRGILPRFMTWLSALADGDPDTVQFLAEVKKTYLETRKEGT